MQTEIMVFGKLILQIKIFKDVLLEQINLNT